MSNSGLIPEIIASYKVYKGTGENLDDPLLGIGNNLTLPTLSQITETLSGAGILGEYEAANPGHFSALDMTIPYVAVSEGMFDFDTSQRLFLTIRSTQQSTVQETGGKTYSGIKVIVGGDIKEINLGKLEQGKQGDSSITLGLTYIKVEIKYKNEDGSENTITALELDKFNDVYTLNDVDQLANIKQFT